MMICRSQDGSLTLWDIDWEAKPSSPESIRLISMGKMLNDKSRLSGRIYFPDLWTVCGTDKR